MIYLLTAIGLSPSGSSKVHIYTQTIQRTTQKQCIEQHKIVRRLRGRAPSLRVLNSKKNLTGHNEAYM
jgi:hypothetical protein